MPATLKDVAAAAGVSTSTASRVLDPRLPRSSTAAAERVRKAAEDLGYQRDVNASALRRGGGTGSIGVIVPRLTDTVMAMMFEALVTEVRKRGKFAIVSTSDDDPDRELAATESLLSRRVDGLVLGSVRIQDRLSQSLRERGIPHALVLRTDGISPSAVSDDDLGGYLATRHLLDLGHRRIGLIGGPDHASTSRGRLNGYMRAMTEAGIVPDPRWIQRMGFGYEDGADAAHQLLTQAPDLTALFCANDKLAVGAMSVANILGIRVPEDLSVVGYNDTPIASWLPVRLTSVHVHFEGVASAAIDILDRWEAEQHMPTDVVTTIMPTLMPRETSIPYRGNQR